MKLLLCQQCYDVFKLQYEPRQCRCGSCGGNYIDEWNAVYWGGPAVPIGFANSSFAEAVRNRPKAGLGKTFTAFVIPRDCDTMKFESR